ncbi:hypothetical protein ASF64_17220 [Arthrobacter sp. Leaf137]|nr:hypothetical protein ASF64_17220 [Arthrobacter sp. Leaf137]
MQSKICEWHASAPVSIEGVLRDDHQGIDLVVRIPRGIPKHEWALDLGDALHNFRSAFDAMAWGMAHFDGAEPSRPKAVAFPICLNDGQWKDAAKAWISKIRPEFQERLRLLQPFTFAPGEVTVMSMLHELDIQDKHHDSLTVKAEVHALNVEATFEYQDPSSKLPPRVEMYEDVKFSDGAVLGTIHAGGEIRMVGDFFLQPDIKVQLEYKNGVQDVLPMLQQFSEETRRCLDILKHGLAPADESASGEWLPLNIG